MKIAIVKYNAGNVQSVINALHRLSINEIVVTDNPETLNAADKIIFPGVGNANAAMQYLVDKKLDKIIISLKQPVLGICVGLQLMCNYSEEGNTTCMGIFNTNVKLFKDSDKINSPNIKYKIPQMGWNKIYDFKSPLFYNLPDSAFVYNVHSYYAELSTNTIATIDYILPYAAALQKNNFFAVQFHVEKSGKIGETILKNFISL